MPQVEKLKIFLASPGDVRTERNHVFKVVDELNRTVASDKGVILQVICSKNAYPGYGKDGQAIINEQIGKMSDYVLFIGIMWNRGGTPTKRAISGTVEEYQRAKRTFKRIGQPSIWFYFRSMTEGLKKKAELEQQEKVRRFKNSYTKNRLGLFHEYKNPSEFRDNLREHITLWLNQRNKKRARKSINASNLSVSSSINKTPASQLQSSEKSAKSSTTSNSTTKNQSATNAKSAKTNSITDSGAWILLDDYLFETQTVDTLTNQNILLNIRVLNAEQEARLRNLQQNSQHYNRKQLIYAYRNDATMVLVENVETKSIKGKTSYILTLKPVPHSHGNNIVNYYSSTYEQTAELLIRFLLLNEVPKSQDKSHQSTLDYIIRGNDYPLKPKGCVFTDIWKKWKNEPKMFLINARLAAVSYLKINNIVEHILDLKINLISKNVISLQFSGHLKQFYSNQETRVVNIKGKCTFDS
ncbi:MAG: hypothetical protein RM338_03715 [Nostoc sp. DedQUE12a]|nr:hypothetical protein [Nostoc sp. DedQUE12a]